MIFTLDRGGKVFTSFDNSSLDFNTRLWRLHWKLLCIINLKTKTHPTFTFSLAFKAVRGWQTWGLAFHIFHVIYAEKTAIFNDLSCSLKFIKKKKRKLLVKLAGDILKC